MRTSVALVNLVLGVAYTSYGVMTLIELKCDWKTMGFSHFGAAWVAMAFTCGPHHLAHGLHVGFEGRAPGGIDLAAVLVGLPVGVIWLGLRVEAFAGGRGDRFVSDTPRWLAAMPALGAAYLGALAVAAMTMAFKGFLLPAMAVPNILLFGIYMTIGYFLLRTQLRNRPAAGGWSVSGLSLTTVFPTCAVMHAVWVMYAATGVWSFDVHGFAIDWLGVPAGLYFLWVVRGLYHDALKDWNRAPHNVPGPAVPIGRSA
ncbi:MAG: hypothetical protein ACRDJM_07320 [Actinomycetota bacterium]